MHEFNRGNLAATNRLLSREQRNGVADTTLRALACQGVSNRFADRVATTRSTIPLQSLLATVTRRKRKRGRSVRGLEHTDKDLEVLKAIADPRFTVAGFSNEDLRQLLDGDPRYAGKTDRQRSGMTTRSLRLPRDHGVIRRFPKARRYHLTSSGRALVTVVLAALAASTEELAKIAA